MRVEEGSIDIVVSIGAYASALFTTISGYGDFWDGLSRIMEHARLAGRFICNQVLKRSKAKGASRKNVGSGLQYCKLKPLPIILSFLSANFKSVLDRICSRFAAEPNVVMSCPVRFPRSPRVQTPSSKTNHATIPRTSDNLRSLPSRFKSLAFTEYHLQNI